MHNPPSYESLNFNDNQSIINTHNNPPLYNEQSTVLGNETTYLPSYDSLILNGHIINHNRRLVGISIRTKNILHAILYSIFFLNFIFLAYVCYSYSYDDLNSKLFSLYEISSSLLVVINLAYIIILIDRLNLVQKSLILRFMLTLLNIIVFSIGLYYMINSGNTIIFSNRTNVFIFTVNIIQISLSGIVFNTLFLIYYK
jgi:hypothetical protein